MREKGWWSRLRVCKGAKKERRRVDSLPRDPVFPPTKGLTTFILIVSDLGATVKEYMARFRMESPHERRGCPSCGRAMHRHGCFRRWVWFRRSPSLVPIYRQYCPGCGLTASLLPAFIKPFQRLCLHDLERVLCLYVEGVSIERLAEELGVEPLTLRRWLRRLAERAPAHGTWLARRILLTRTVPDPTRGPARSRRDTINLFLRLTRRFYAGQVGEPPPGTGSLLAFNLASGGDW